MRARESKRCDSGHWRVSYSAHVTDRRGTRYILDFAEEGVKTQGAGEKRCRNKPCEEKKRNKGKGAGTKLKR
jgi:hypothetical protein